VYGYGYLPLLLSLAAPPLSILLPSPLPASTPLSVATSKYPYSTLRKQLRLLIDDNPESLEEVENDIGYVYSGYAPISIRLVQCVAQKGGVLSNPAAEKDKGAGDGGKGKRPATSKVQAHPIVGWKGFEDVLASIPGETFDFVQKGLAGAESAGQPMASCKPCPCVNVFRRLTLSIHVSKCKRSVHDYCGVFPWWMHLYRNRCLKVGE
jgi:vacuolar protein sorting-associated protein 33A